MSFSLLGGGDGGHVDGGAPAGGAGAAAADPAALRGCRWVLGKAFSPDECGSWQYEVLDAAGVALRRRVMAADEVQRAAMDEPEVADAVAGSDLVKGVYEGGFTVWETSLDLVRFLVQAAQSGLPGSNVAGARVLELGAGCGLPGIWALLSGASVDFQDYNSSVLQHYTHANLLLNVEDPSTRARARYLAGDWGRLGDVAEPHSYNLVLTTDTLYSPESVGRLYDAIETSLAPMGMALVAAKTYYFGVGGGIQQLEEVVAARGVLSLESVLRYEDGRSNIREIVLLRHKTS